jgi:hypothetical protein
MEAEQGFVPQRRIQRKQRGALRRRTRAEQESRLSYPFTSQIIETGQSIRPFGVRVAQPAPSIMIPGLKKIHRFVANAVDQPVLLRDSA